VNVADTIYETPTAEELKEYSELKSIDVDVV